MRIIYLHLVSDSTRQHFPSDKTLDIKAFRKTLKFLMKGNQFISISEALECHKSGTSTKGKIVLTTDDGFVENYTVIAPIAEEFGIKPTLFLIEDCIDNKKLMWRHGLFVLTQHFDKQVLKNKAESVLPHLNKFNDADDLMSWSLREWQMKEKDLNMAILWNSLMPCSLDEYLSENKPYLSTKQVNKLINKGFDVGCHTRSHPSCSKLNEEEIVTEIQKSAVSLKEKFSLSNSYFSFPFQRAENVMDIVSDFSPKVDVALGTKELLNASKLNPLFWERTSIEFRYPKSVLNFYLNPLFLSVKNL
ncbi:polysaccharide deacetylase family protein [Roseivirga misakiensis]|uniref:NodB homology domain-containing protein n=1 Tax=Roseivirga misakiensis TaxID=1563681 RepID=A0A1E5T5V6_9BACT|nr:polysaccharide deacetylase family protein [Roseivirga misakiensis]OEK06772.1 hypothetical protein BFP71_03675 [Roseivirga misakiensis]